MTKRKNSFFQRKGLALFSAVILVISILVFFQEETLAVPIFARKYSTSCMTCHVGFPKLNAFGEAFKTNGYRLPNDEVFVKEPAVELGSEAYKRVWPNAVWPGSIPSNVPLSLQIQGQGFYDRARRTTNGQARTDFEFPKEIVLNSLGTMGDNFSFLLDYSLQDAEKRAGVERVFLEYNDILAGKVGIPHHLLNMRVGLLDPAAMPFSATQTLTADTPEIYNFHISSTHQPAISDDQTGMELFGVVDKRVRYTAGVVNGVTRDKNTEAFNDNNSDKDVYGRVEYKFGGLPFDGDADSKNQAQLGSGFSYFDQGPSLMLGTTGYYGKDQIDAATDKSSRYYRWTGFLRANKGRYNMDVVYLYQLDNNDVGQINSGLGKNIGNWGFYSEGTAFIYPWLAFVARYERLNIGHVSVLRAGGVAPADNTSRLTLSLPIYVRPNLRIIPEISAGVFSLKNADESDNFKLRIHYAY